MAFQQSSTALAPEQQPACEEQVAMSRGPGTLQRRVLETLATYARLGTALQWKWPGGRRYSLASYADADSIAGYERGRYVPVWILLRDLGCSRADLSRALKSLERKDLVRRSTGSLDSVGYPTFGKSCKFATITPEGEARLKSQQKQNVEVGTYQPMPAWNPT
jgi:hypothetical protein